MKGAVVKTIVFKGNYGENTIHSDGMNDHDSPTKKGICFYELRSESRSQFGKIVKI